MHERKCVDNGIYLMICASLFTNYEYEWSTLDSSFWHLCLLTFYFNIQTVVPDSLTTWRYGKTIQDRDLPVWWVSESLHSCRLSLKKWLLKLEVWMSVNLEVSYDCILCHIQNTSKCLRVWTPTLHPHTTGIWRCSSFLSSWSWHCHSYQRKSYHFEIKHITFPILMQCFGPVIFHFN